MAPGSRHCFPSSMTARRLAVDWRLRQEVLVRVDSEGGNATLIARPTTSPALPFNQCDVGAGSVGSKSSALSAELRGPVTSLAVSEVRCPCIVCHTTVRGMPIQQIKDSQDQMRSLTGLANKLGSKGVQRTGLLNAQACSLSEIAVPFGCCHTPRARDRPLEGPVQDFLCQVRFCSDVVDWPNLSHANASPTAFPRYRARGAIWGPAATHCCQQLEKNLPYPPIGPRGE